MTDTGAPWRRVRDDIAAGITDGRWPVGSTLPSYSDLARRYEVSVQTVSRAVRDLREAGALRGERGVSVTVVGVPTMDEPPADVTVTLADHENRIGALEAALLDVYGQIGRPRPTGGTERKDRGHGRPDRPSSAAGA